MTMMLQNIFSAEVAGDEIAVRTGIIEDETSLVGLRFAADVRTNSIIVTGSAGALTVVEAVLARLDGSDARQRDSIVYRLRNTAAVAVATAIAFMHATKTLHPPGGATALIAVIGSEKIHSLGYLYAVIPAGAGALIMLVVALLVNNLSKNRRYPEFWY